VIWLWIALGLLGLAALVCLGFHFHIVINYLQYVERIFQERPLFIIPHAPPAADAEEVSLITADGLTLRGCYLKTPKPRKGVILFGLEYGCNRWGCLPYTDFLRDGGYDIFTFEMRGQGESQAQAGYEPLQWVTDFEVEDFQTAVEYLKKRSDANPLGIGFFGLSKGGSAGLWVGAHDPWLRCFVTDGAFAHITTIVPYEKKWINIYARLPWLGAVIPDWYYACAARMGVRRVERARGTHYPELESVLDQLSPRPWLMIHGEKDNYIRPEMAQTLFACARQPKELWLVDKAKHNQAMQVANGEYRRRILAFFDEHLGPSAMPRVEHPQAPPDNGSFMSSRSAESARPAEALSAAHSGN
jgi:pimeloyl-ACP methyl ester carboxylesterase